MKNHPILLILLLLTFGCQESEIKQAAQSESQAQKTASVQVREEQERSDFSQEQTPTEEERSIKEEIQTLKTEQITDPSSPKEPTKTTPSTKVTEPTPTEETKVQTSSPNNPVPTPQPTTSAPAPVKSNTKPSAPKKLSHQAWDELLQKYVSTSGKVNYKGFRQDKTKLASYLDQLSENTPKSSWSRDQKLAYWINAYNAFTVKLIIDNYPLTSITKLDKPWKTPFIKLGGKSYTLNQIENEIIRPQFQEPRIHFAVNCASFSCPKLLNQAYTASKLDAQLTAQTKAYINNPAHNSLSSNKIEISQLFEWYQTDFTQNASLISFLNQYSNTQIKSNAKISYKNYNWELNE